METREFIEYLKWRSAEFQRELEVLTIERIHGKDIANMIERT